MSYFGVYLLLSFTSIKMLAHNPPTHPDNVIINPAQPHSIVVNPRGLYKYSNTDKKVQPTPRYIDNANVFRKFLTFKN